MRVLLLRTAEGLKISAMRHFYVPTVLVLALYGCAGASGSEGASPATVSSTPGAVASSLGPSSPGLAEEALRQADLERLARQAPLSDEEAARLGDERLSQLGRGPDGCSSVDGAAVARATLVRTDFSDTRRWEALQQAVMTAAEGQGGPAVTTVDRPGGQGASVAAALAEGADADVVLIADGETLSAPDMPVLVVCADAGVTTQVRVAAEALWSGDTD